jgi:segregation and condensation protein A
MEAITYRLDQFEGPLDLLLNLISKNKVSIADIPIAMICDQYLAYIVEAKELNMDIASEFIVMASELILIKSKMLLPKPEEDEEDPRAMLADALLRYKQAKEAAVKLAPMFAYYSGRMVKDTDEISVDKTFVADQSPLALEKAIRQIIAANNALERAQQTAFKPMISKPVVPVELKIVGILKRMDKGGGKATLRDLLDDSVSLPDLIAIFIGVLELIKVKKILIDESDDVSDLPEGNLHGENTRFIINTNEDEVEESTGDVYN